MDMAIGASEFRRGVEETLELNSGERAQSLLYSCADTDTDTTIRQTGGWMDLFICHLFSGGKNVSRFADEMCV